MKLLHASGFSAPEREAFRGFVFANMLGAMQSILTAMKEHKMSLTVQTNEVCWSTHQSARLLLTAFPSILETWLLTPISSVWLFLEPLRNTCQSSRRYHESRTVLHTHQNTSQRSKHCGRIHQYKRFTSSDTHMHSQTTWNSMFTFLPNHYSNIDFFTKSWVLTATAIHRHSFFESVDRLYKSDYIPDDADILRCRVKSTGITETTFHLGTLTYR